MKKIAGGVWSAAPTPLTQDLKIDGGSMRRQIEQHIKMGVKGMFIGGTSGEGPWLKRGQMLELAKICAEAADDKIIIALQVTDNSAGRMIEFMAEAADTGVDLFVIAPPFFQVNPDQAYLKKMMLETIDASPFPIGLYHRGKHSSVQVDAATLADVAGHPDVVMIKDSSASQDDRDIFLKCAQQNPKLTLLNGLEFDNVSYLKAGYDGMLSGGACFTGLMSAEIFNLCSDSNYEQAEAVQAAMNDLMYKVFGGKDCHCWLAGQKYIMKKLGIFADDARILNYQLDAECRAVIDEIVESGKFALPFHSDNEVEYALS